MNIETVPIDSRQAFVLSLIDEQLSLRSLVDVSGMSENEVLTILDRLARLHLVVIE